MVKFLKRLLRRTGSMQFGLILFVLTMGLSMLGTVVPGWSGSLYHSWPFMTLLLLLVLNTGLCTVRQTRSVFGFRRGAWAMLVRRWSVWLIHVAILLVAVGSLWSALVARDGAVELAVGETARLPAGVVGGQAWDLKLEGFRREYHPDGSSAGWFSQVRLSPGAQPDNFLSAEIAVNHPLESGGLSILQASWGSRYELLVQVAGQGRQIVVKRNELLALDASSGLGVIFQDPRPMAGRAESPEIGYLALVNGKVVGSAWAKLGQVVAVDRRGLRFTIQRRIETSGLMLRYDPAVPFLWAGFAVLALAVCGLFLGARKAE